MATNLTEQEKRYLIIAMTRAAIDLATRHGQTPQMIVNQFSSQPLMMIVEASNARNREDARRKKVFLS